MRKKLLWMMLVVLLMLLMLPVGVLAAEVESGTCGENLTWRLEDGTLTISGTGEMTDYYSDNTTRPPYGENLKKVIIQNGVTSIGDRAFYDCMDLSSIELPNSVTSIGYGAFSCCYNLSSIELPNSVTSIGDRAFSGCHTLSSIELSNSVTSIGEGAFYFCISLNSIELPNSVTSIGDEAFSHCYNLSSIELPNGVTSIGDRVFIFCIGLTSIELSNSITSIGDGCFSDCRSLSSIVLPDSVISIGEKAFSWCISLRSIELPNNVRVIGKNAFEYCGSLSSIELPNSVNIIRNETFRDCSNLSSIGIPNNVAIVESSAFNGCYNLTDVYYKGSENDWKSMTIGEANAHLVDATIHYNSTGIDGTDIMNIGTLTFKDVCYKDTIAKADVTVKYLSWNWNDLFVKDSSYRYNSDLAKMGVVLTAAITGSEKDIQNILMDDDKLDCDYYTFVSTLSPAMAVGMKKVKIDGETKYVIFVVLRGTTTIEDINTDVLSAMGKAQWGSDAVYDRLSDCLEGWNKNYGTRINKDNTKFFITGFSLGGACANLLSGSLSKEYKCGEENVFGYTFAAPSPMDNETQLKDYGGERHGNIYNFLCYQDFVPTHLGSRNRWYGCGWPKWFNMRKLNTTASYYHDELTGKKWQDTFNENLGTPFVPEWFSNPVSVVALGLHTPSIYLAYLETDPNLKYSISTYNYACVACPVDVEVYNSKSELVGRIVNDEIDYSHYTPDVKLIVSDGTKYVYFLNDDTYMLKCIGNGDGTMSYTAATRDMNSETDKESIVYSNVKISPGKKFESVVSSYNETNTDNSVAISDVKLVVTDDSGNAVSQVMSDAEASASGKDNGTEVPVKSPDSPSTEPENLPFVDVNQADWYYDPAKFVFSRKIMTGMDNTHFGPGGLLSRAQFATILYRMEGSPEAAYNAGAFPDVLDGEFFTSPAMWAKSTGVITGYADGSFGPADDITREQMAVMMYRYAGMLKLDTSVRGDLGSFPDGSSVSGFAQEAMKWAIGEELIRGDSGKINPQGKAERGQCATIIMRYMQKYGL